MNEIASVFALWFIYVLSRCHQHADSLFSTSSGFTNYRGMLNLCGILLALSMGRVALENIIKYGILIDPIQWLQVFLSHPYSWPSVCIVISLNIFIFCSFYIECLLSKGSLSESSGSYLHIINLSVEVTLPAALVLHIHPNPCFSSPALGICVIVFLKLISYVQVNRWCRLHLARGKARSKRLRRTSLSSDRLENKNCSEAIPAQKLTQYPNNLNLEDLFYFLFAPTLCYQLNFPRSVRIRKRFLLKRLIEMVFLSGLMLALIQQWIIPIVQNSTILLQRADLGRILERLLKLAVPNLFIWVAFFYWFFHSCLNTSAELLQFGDRVFYRDWWNAENVSTFWQNWNIPVHKWASRHVYKPMLGAGFSNMQASVSVFLISAFFHEYLVSIPLQMFRLWAFSAMLMQVPLAMFSAKYFSGQVGNIIMWLSLIIGQPVAILMYYHDYYVQHVLT
ncbi:hypothetical protein CAPTEDRAFT_183593 [Capitella teleta]|uniref:O-acyltransferase n=1 Tax=Capitella teleta TaxID=283909 RepID=R7TAV6_CAPTE|nr:hypothetical protein CAPTEDRAFT_183593 [Capitella teleta]|eukprot:ELT88627.1 hypothetical protein CAPTEDRAFT_183593 [Capitella teleta]